MSNPTAVLDEGPAFRSWAKAAFVGTEDAPPTQAPFLEVRRHDFDHLRVNESIMNTPLCLAGKKFAKGLGTHANSEVVVHLEKPGGIFEAVVGIDDNYDTKTKRGTVEFIVEVAGKELFHSDVRKGSSPALPIKVDLGDAKEFTLKVTDAGDGPACDQSDWCDAKVTQNGKVTRLDGFPVKNPPLLQHNIPFSLLADSKPISDWSRASKKLKAPDGQEKFEVAYSSLSAKLTVTAELTLYGNSPAADWTLHIRNDSSDKSPLITELKPLDVALNFGGSEVSLHGITGSLCNQNDFVPFSQNIINGFKKEFAPNGGRSSDGIAPFFNIKTDDGGLIAAIGWTGQWSMNLSRTGAVAHLQAGQQTTHFRLNPGEEVRTPRIVLLKWDGKDAMRGHNLFRKLVVDHLGARTDGKLDTPPVSQNTWFTCDAGNNVTEKNQIDAINEMKRLGVEAYWLDAGWFKGGWPAGAGNWDPKPEAFPNGLKPVGDAAHANGMKFILWFEPERVTLASAINTEHPQWVMHAGPGDGLFNLGDPKARQWLTDFLLERIDAWGVDVYRNDFNIDPLRFWQAADAPDRQGISEIRYIEGLYRMWSDLRERHKGLTIDNCASGGRRIDIEMTGLSYPLWQSDTQCFAKAEPVQDQDQNLGLSLYIPVHSAGVWQFDQYAWHSVATTGVSLCLDTKSKEYVPVDAKKRIAETKRLRPLLLGDYYPLLATPFDAKQWVGWQYDRPDLGEGFFALFRRESSPYLAIAANLRAIDPKATYEVTFVGTEQKEQMKGKDLASMVVKIDKPGQCQIVIYKRKKA